MLARPICLALLLLLAACSNFFTPRTPAINPVGEMTPKNGCAHGGRPPCDM